MNDKLVKSQDRPVSHKNPAITDFYFSCWCEEHGINQISAQIISNTAEIQTMEDAAKEFAKILTEKEPVIILVQDWRGRIAKFKIMVQQRLEYYARRIK